MRKYRPKTLAANVSDRLMRFALSAVLGVGWFVWLWGLSLPALTAGLALGVLLWLCARLFGKNRVEKREKQMRRMLGGELAIGGLMLMKPRHAAFQAAVWLAPKLPLEMHRAVDWGVTGVLEGKPALLWLVAQHESVPVDAQRVIEAAREARGHRAERLVLCSTAPLTREAEEALRDLPMDARLVKRDELAAYAGLCHPATDEDLAKLKHRKRKRLTAREWADVVFDPGRARRYLWYGAGMAALALVTGQWAYPLPAAVCLSLYAGCKLRGARSERCAAR